ncbi:MAG TPA: hypothetical protein VEY67_08855 [Candidatus Dormibacteraeota bacterium]|nr:hypothetical protein [Candidatus Dormibacteraeota bacterium]
MTWNVVLPATSSLVSFVFAYLLYEQWRDRRRPYQLIWMLGMLWYGISAGTEALGGAIGWGAGLYRAWYLIGAVYVAGWLGLGTVYLLARTRFGYCYALSLLLAGLFTYLSWRRYAYAQTDGTEYVYPAIALGLAIVIAVLTYRGDERWAQVAGVATVVGSVAAALMAATVFLPAPGYSLDPVTGNPDAALFPGYLRLLTPLFNVTGGLALVLGALYSAYVFMPKRRILRYSLRRDQPAAGLVRNLLVAPVAIVVNFVASLPAAVSDLLAGRLNSRVPATILIAIGGFIPSLTSGANRFGMTELFFLGELLGAVFLFLGFLASTEVFPEIRVPFTDRVLFARRAGA